MVDGVDKTHIPDHRMGLFNIRGWDYAKKHQHTPTKYKKKQWNYTFTYVCFFLCVCVYVWGGAAMQLWGVPTFDPQNYHTDLWVPAAWLPSETSMIHLGFWGLTTAGWLLKTCAHDITQSNVTELLDLPAFVSFCVCDVRQHSTGISGDFAVRPASKQSWAREIRAPLACKGGGRYRFNAAGSCDSPIDSFGEKVKPQIAGDLKCCSTKK